MTERLIISGPNWYVEFKKEQSCIQLFREFTELLKYLRLWQKAIKTNKKLKENNFIKEHILNNFSNFKGLGIERTTISLKENRSRKNI